MEDVQRNYLEIKSLNELIYKKKPNDNFSVEKVSKNDFQLNKFFYRQVGKKHRWIDRLSWSDEKWVNYISNQNLETYGCLLAKRCFRHRSI